MAQAEQEFFEIIGKEKKQLEKKQAAEKELDDGMEKGDTGKVSHAGEWCIQTGAWEMLTVYSKLTQVSISLTCILLLEKKSCCTSSLYIQTFIYKK